MTALDKVSEREEVPMAIVGGLDVHRQQITFDYLDTETGEVRRGEIRPATRDRVRAWLGRFAGQEAAFALEATTGWRFVTEELRRAGIQAHLAEPADTRALRGPKRRAKTDREDARHLRELLALARLPECWIPPEPIQELRTRVRLRHVLVSERTAWLQRIQAQLFHHGLPPSSVRSVAGRRQLNDITLPAAAQEAVDLARRMVAAINHELDPLERELRRVAARHPACGALMGHFGIGELTSVVILAELGDARRFRKAGQAVRYVGLDVTVYASDTKRAAGHLSHQGPAVLRWALFEAAQCAWRPSAPDHAYYLEAKARLRTHERACIAVARRLLRRAYHTLRGLEPQLLEMAA